MSDTPQTNSIAHKGYNESAYIAEMTDLARTLERELAAERARLDWLNGVDGMDWFTHCDYGIATRAAIDAAMKENLK